MQKNNLLIIKEEAKNSAIKKIKKRLLKNKDFASIEKLNQLLENGKL
tara:strand:+ start:2879 stop:3019 length:141 start_codon:yes stop_codon:yes gene_type:complete